MQLERDMQLADLIITEKSVGRSNMHCLQDSLKIFVETICKKEWVKIHKPRAESKQKNS